MTSNRLFNTILMSLALCASSMTPCLASPLPNSLLKKRALSDLDSIHSIFDVKYAPKQWKKEYANWDLDQSIEEAKNKVATHPTPTVKDCQVIIRDFFNSTKDYHVGVRFFSTESASLPFLVKGAEGRYFICYIDRDQLSKREFPFEVGDEILTFGGHPVHEVIEELQKQEYGSNTHETDRALAELSLTNRRGDMGHLIPSGKISVSGIKKSNQKSMNVDLKWSYTPEKVRDFSKLGANVGVQASIQEWNTDFKSALKHSNFFEKLMVCHLWDKSSHVGAFTEANKHSLGARTSFIPPLGKKVWKSGSDMVFDAYIFEAPSGKKIGYIRIPHYIGDEEEVEEFGTIMNYFEKRTDALVIDQLNNPGGSIFYLYGLAATLTDKPIYAPKHHIALTQEEVYIAHLLLPYLEQVDSDQSAQDILGGSVGGYPVDYEFIKLMKQFCHFLIDQWDSGKLYSDPTFLFGVNEIKPHPDYHYSKPILLLINSLDFSCGDFFPTILQDSKRATVMGTRTAGAGGYVLATNLPNHSGIQGFMFTGSLAERINHKPIENLGVTPDIPYELSANDLQDDFREYVDAVLETVDSLAKSK